MYIWIIVEFIMVEWILEQTTDFEKEFDKLIPKNLQERVKKQILKLKENPFVGKPLGVRFFREKKFDKWRVYFLIYEEKIIVYFVGISNKKLQQHKIDLLRELFKPFKEEIENKFI